MTEFENIFRHKKIVLIGGGTGSSVFLRTLKKYTSNITAIVAVSDDGGSTGFMRSNFGIIAPGDIRSCIVALSEDESMLASLLDVRFTESIFKTQSFGNIMLAAMNKVTSSFPLAVKLVSNVLAIKGQVLPVTTENVILEARTSRGRIIRGESKIARHCERTKSKIEKIQLIPQNAPLYFECRRAIEEADIILLCPGSLYTSLIPNILVQGMPEALSRSRAKKYWIMNIMTQRGETVGYTLSDHVKTLEMHAGMKIADVIVYNTADIAQSVLDRYKKENSAKVENDLDDEIFEKYETAGVNAVSIEDEMVRHNSEAVWQLLSELESGR